MAAESVLFCVTNELSTENGWCATTISIMKNACKSGRREIPHRKSTGMSKMPRAPCMLYYTEDKNNQRGCFSSGWP